MVAPAASARQPAPVAAVVARVAAAVVVRMAETPVLPADKGYREMETHHRQAMVQRVR